MISRRKLVDLLALQLGERVIDIQKINNGKRAQVFLAEKQGGAKVIVKLENAWKHQNFLKMEYVLKLLHKNSLKFVPKPIKTGAFVDKDKYFTYTIYNYLPGKPANQAKKDPLKLWRQAGAMARKINQIPLVGYHVFVNQTIFHTSLNSQEYFSLYFQQLKYFYKHMDEKKHFSTKEIKKMQDVFENLNIDPQKSVVTHGDLALKNFLLKENGEISYLIDWTESRAFPPGFEVGSTIFWLSPKEQDAFLKGYGISDNFSEWKSEVYKYQILKYVPEGQVHLKDPDNQTQDFFTLRLKHALNNV